MREWSESDIALAKAVADQTGIAIRQAQPLSKAEETSKREVLVNNVTMAIRASLSLPGSPEHSDPRTWSRVSCLARALAPLRSGKPISPVEHEYLAPGCNSIGPFQPTITTRLAGSYWA